MTAVFVDPVMLAENVWVWFSVSAVVGGVNETVTAVEVTPLE